MGLLNLRKRQERAEAAGETGSGINWTELTLDKIVDFVLIFVGLYAAMSVERCQAESAERDDYATLLKDFAHELEANREQEKSIEKDLGPIDQATPPNNYGPVEKTFETFFADLEHDESLVHCLHAEFAREKHALRSPECHAAYAKFHAEHKKQADGQPPTAQPFSFKPAVLTPFYRYEVWQIYLAGGVKTFKNKDLAVQIGEVYNNAHLIERQVAEIEKLYNEVFMRQVGRSLATDAELAEIIEDEEEDHALSADDRKQLLDASAALKDERSQILELKGVLALQVERLKNTVLTMRHEIDAAKEAIATESAKLGR